jgi:hypothetical protein
VVPSGDMVHARFMVALTSAIQWAGRVGIETVLINPRSALIATGRQMGVEAALLRGCSHIWWLDSDMVFPPAALGVLFRTEEDVVGATYVRRQSPPTLTHRELNGAEPFVGKGVREVETLPSGCLLVAARVYGDLEKPYYRCSYEDGREVGEDVNFCRAVRATGRSIWLDADLSQDIGHVGVHIYNSQELPHDRR